MYLKMLVNDFKRKKVITSVLFLFILLAATLAASGTQMFLSLNGAMNNLFEKANTPHYSQYHNGNYDENYVNDWVKDHPDIKEWEVMETPFLSDISIYLNNEPEKLDTRSSMFIFAKQNESIDILLALDGEPASVSDGHIAVPVIFLQWADIAVGDTLKIKIGDDEKTFIISDFIRDSALGSTMMGTKRFIISENDLAALIASSESTVRLFNFVLNNDSELTGFTQSYSRSAMPQNGFFYDRSLIMMASTTSDGVIIGLVLLCSILLILIALLTLRYTILSAIEEDFREIGMMKAIGFGPGSIIRLYLSKYLFLSSIACVSGFLLAQLVFKAINSNLLLFYGTSENIMGEIIASIGSLILVFVIINLFCFTTLRQIGKMTVIDAIRMNHATDTFRSYSILKLTVSRYLNPNLFFAFKDVLTKLKTYVLLFVVYLLCAFITILPINIKNTLANYDTLSNMGFMVSDLQIRPNEVFSAEEVRMFSEFFDGDEDVTQWVIMTGELYKLKYPDGETQSFGANVGEQSIFTGGYYRGTYPELENEIAISYLLAKDLAKNVGDSIILIIEGEERHKLISGIYQEVSNGGRSMRANLNHGTGGEVINWGIYVNINGNRNKKAVYYEKSLNASVLTLEKNYDQFLGDMVNQIDQLSQLLLVIAILVSALISALFIKMLIAKEIGQIAIMKSIGFAQKHLRLQYVSRIGLVLLCGIILGTLFTNILGEKIMGAVFTSMGAPSISFFIEPIMVYVIVPIALFIVVITAIIIGCGAIRKISISQLNND